MSAKLLASAGITCQFGEGEAVYFLIGTSLLGAMLDVAIRPPETRVLGSLAMSWEVTCKPSSP